MAEPSAIDPRRCPLCGAANECNIANRRQHQPCWCREESFPQSLLDSIPPAAKLKACICMRCAQTHTIPDRKETL